MSLGQSPIFCVAPRCGGCWPPPSPRYWTRTLSLIAAGDLSLSRVSLTWCRGSICKSSRARHTHRWSLTRRGNTARSCLLLCAAYFRQKWLVSVFLRRFQCLEKFDCYHLSLSMLSPEGGRSFFVGGLSSNVDWSHVGAGASEASSDKLLEARPGSGAQSPVTGDSAGDNTQSRGQRLGDYFVWYGVLSGFIITFETS